MRQYPNVKLHAKYTDLSFYAGLIFFPFVFLLLFLIVDFQELNVNNILFTVAIVIILALTIYLFINLSKVEIIDNRLHVQKYFRPKEVYEFSDLQKVKTYEMGNAKHIQVSEKGIKGRRDFYTFFTMNKNGISKKYLVVGYNFYFGDESADADKILKEILAENQKLN